MTLAKDKNKNLNNREKTKECRLCNQMEQVLATVSVSPLLLKPLNMFCLFFNITM